MINPLRCERTFMLAVASVLFYSTCAFADGPSPELPDADDSGFTILSNATNVTHWGLGAGVGYEQAPYKTYGTKFSPIPLFFFDDKWVHAIGTTIDLKIGKWRNLSFALRGKYDIGDGYKGSDANFLNGMQNRSGAFWFGPSLSWETNYGTLSGDFLTGGNKGQQANVEFGKALEYGAFSIEPHVGATWQSSKYVDYYYGVRASEVRAGRPEYHGKSAYNEELGTKFDYRLTNHQVVTVDVGVAHLGSGITDSPIVGKKFIPEAKLGYLYQFN